MQTRTRQMTAALCAAVALLAGVAAAVGVFARGNGTFQAVTSVRGETYRMATDGVYANNAQQVVAEGVGWDLFTLAVAVPGLLIASFLVARGSFRATLIAAGLVGYFLYMYLEYSVTWAFGPLFPLFIVIHAASLIGLLGLVALIGGDGIHDRFDEGFPRHAWAGLSVGVGVLLTVLWIGRIAEGLTSPTPVLHGETTMTVQALDLGLVVPVSVVTAALALRRHAVGLAASAAFAVTFVMLSAAITAMMISSWIVTGFLAVPPIVVFGGACIGGLLLIARMYGSVHHASTSVMQTPAGGRTVDLPAAG